MTGRLLAMVGAMLVVAAGCSAGASPDVTKLRDPASIAAGSALFQANCAACHGADLGGGRSPGGGLAPSLAAKVGPSDVVLIETVKRGRGFAMPAFDTQLTDGEIVSIIDYVRSVQVEQLEE